jgi:hypothetical protein
MAVFGLLSLQVLVARQFAQVSHSVSMEWGVKENHVAVIAFTTAENPVLKFLNS